MEFFYGVLKDLPGGSLGAIGEPYIIGDFAVIAAVGGKINEIFNVVHLVLVVVPFVLEVPGGFLWGVGFVFANELDVVAVFEAVEEEVMSCLSCGAISSAARVIGGVAASVRIRIGGIMRRCTGFLLYAFG